MLRRSFLALTSALTALGLTACRPMAKPAAAPTPAPASGTYQLTRLNGKAFTRRATIIYDETGIIAGQGPCNTWRGGRWDSYPDIRLTQIAVTRMRCANDADNAAEGHFLTALGQIDHAEFTDHGLILSGTQGQHMEFTRIRD